MNSMNTIDRVIFNLRNIGNIPDSQKDLKGFKFENGINLITALSKIEEKQKSSLKKNKSTPGNDLLEKRINPYSKDEDSTEFFYLAKKPQLAPIGSATPNPQTYSSPEMMDFLDYNSDGNDVMKISSLIRIGGILNFLKLRKKGNGAESNIEIEDELLTQNDYAILSFLRNDEYILLTVGDEWLCQEIANHSFYTKSHRRYFAILDEILKIISDADTMENLFTIPQYSEPLIKFFVQIPLINENVFLALKDLIESVQEKASEHLNIDTLLACYQELLDKFNGQTEAVAKGIRYLMDLGLTQTIKLVRYKYYPHPSFTSIIEGYLQHDIENLRNPLDDKENENIIKHMLAFALRDPGFLKMMFESFPMFNERAKKILIEKTEKFFGSRFKSLDPNEDIPLLRLLFSENEQGHELLEKLASYLKLYLPLLGISPEDQKAVEEILAGYRERKRVDFYCTWILGDDDSKIDGVITNLKQENMMEDVFIHLHRLAIANDKNIMKIRNIISKKILDQIPYDKILNCLNEICQPSFQGQLSPLSGVTILFVYNKFKKENIKPIQEIYNDLLGKKPIVLLF